MHSLRSSSFHPFFNALLTTVLNFFWFAEDIHIVLKWFLALNRVGQMWFTLTNNYIDHSRGNRPLTSTLSFLKFRFWVTLPFLRYLTPYLFVHSQTRFHSFSFSFFNKQLPFILTHSISSNQTKAKAKANQDEKRKKQRKWTSSTTIEQIENPIRLTRAWREYEQTTLTQLPAFPALCKCNEHPITSNAHWYPSGH